MRARLVSAVALVFIVLLGFQNCGEFRSQISAYSESLSSRIDPRCLESNSDSCLFSKNLVSQKGQPSASLNDMEKQSSQTLAVDFSGIAEGGELRNGSFVVELFGQAGSLRADPATKWRLPLATAGNREKFAQANSFYWANYAAVTALKKTGAFYAGDKTIKIITDSDSRGWSTEKNEIHLSKDAIGRSMAFDASVLVYFLGLANIDFATQGAINSNLSLNHAECMDSGYNCCKNQRGCAQALASGQADYLVAITFPDSPAVGDGWSDVVQGQSICAQAGSFRNPKLNTSMTSRAAFELCSSLNQQGNVYAMGAVYAAIWWSVRQSGGANVDRLFSQHLKELNSEDDFLTALEKIKNLDKAFYGGRFSALFDKEYATRGLKD